MHGVSAAGPSDESIELLLRVQKRCSMACQTAASLRERERPEGFRQSCSAGPTTTPLMVYGSCARRVFLRERLVLGNG